MDKQCERLVHELTLLSLRGSEQLSTLWAAVSLAALSILGRLPIDASQTGVVGELVARFQERAEWCSRLEAFDSRVCDLVLGQTNGRTYLVAHTEEAAG
jgi:hypothetical protein